MKITNNVFISLNWTVDYFMSRDGEIISTYWNNTTLYQNTITGDIYTKEGTTVELK